MKQRWPNCRHISLFAELLIGSTTLSLRNVTRDDGGDYECVADNGVSPADRYSMKLDVKCKTNSQANSSGSRGASGHDPAGPNFSPFAYENMYQRRPLAPLGQDIGP